MHALPVPVSVDEALRGSGTAIEVPDGQNVAVGLFSATHPDLFRIAKVAAFEELQGLELIPRGVSEKDAVDAVTADDLTFRDARNTGGPVRGDACTDCSDSVPRRRMFQANLRALLPPPTSRIAVRSDLELRGVHHSIQRWIDRSSDLLIGVVRPADISIGAGATVAMAPTVEVLHTGVIQISASGVLRFEAGSVSVRCDELRGVADPVIHIDPVHVDVYIPPDWGHFGSVLEPPDPLEFGMDPSAATIMKNLRGVTQEYHLALSQTITS